MFSRILVKLIDCALVPALMLLTVRFASVYLISKQYDIDVRLTTSGLGIESSRFLMLNSYSMLIMVVFLALGLLFILAKSYLFHDSHITPYLAARTFSYNLAFLVQGSFDLYSQAVVWLSYSYLLTLIAGVLAFYSLLYAWVFYVSLSLTVFSSVFFVLDIEKELNLKSRSLRDDDSENDLVLKFVNNPQT